MKFLVVPDDDGQYVNDKCEYFSIIYGGYVVGPRAKDFKEFDTLKHALEYYGLTDTKLSLFEENETEDLERS